MCSNRLPLAVVAALLLVATDASAIIICENDPDNIDPGFKAWCDNSIQELRRLTDCKGGKPMLALLDALNDAKLCSDKRKAMNILITREDNADVGCGWFAHAIADSATLMGGQPYVRIRLNRNCFPDNDDGCTMQPIAILLHELSHARDMTRCEIVNHFEPDEDLRAHMLANVYNCLSEICLWKKYKDRSLPAELLPKSCPPKCPIYCCNNSIGQHLTCNQTLNGDWDMTATTCGAYKQLGACHPADPDGICR